VFGAPISPKALVRARKLAHAEMAEAAQAEVPAPCVGYFKPLAKPIKEGQTVKVGDVLGQIIALGLPNDVESTVGGEIMEILVKDGDPVQFGQTIARVKVSG
jgi:acetyl-CoA carboxylase biotin carboxyl carrier protein